MAENKAQPIKFNNVFRDGIQSNLGTNPSANEMLSMFTDMTAANYDSYQVGGGTFMALFVDKGRDAWGENSKLFGAFKDVLNTALIRGDCLVGYDRNPQDVIEAVIEELAKRGLKEVTNFHGMNDARMQEGVFKAVKKLREEKGYGLTAPKVICIEDSPNFTIKGCLKALRDQIKMGADSGVYLKNANGKADPEFVRELTLAVAKEFPGEEITWHTHNNHGLGYATSLAFVQACAQSGAQGALDVLPPPLSEGTAQINAVKMNELIKNHPDEKVRALASVYDPKGEEQDYEAMYELRFDYRHAETQYSKPLWDALYETGMAGGATSTVKGISGMLDNLKSILKTDEEDAFIKLCEMEGEISEKLGHPTHVTPYQKILTEAAAFELIWRGNPKYELFSKQTAAVQNLLTGGLGEVPKLADNKQIEMALAAKGLDEAVPFVPADEMPQGMHAARLKLHDSISGFLKQSDVALVGLLGEKGLAHIMAKRQGKLKVDPKILPKIPGYLKEPTDNYEFKPDQSVWKYDVVQAIGGKAALEKFAQNVCEIEKSTDGFYKTQVRTSNGDPSEMQDYLNEYYQKWHQQARQDAQEFVYSIPQKLRDYGFREMQVLASLKITNDILADVVDAKAKNASKRSLPALDMSSISTSYNMNADPVNDIHPDNKSHLEIA
ncbi:MAG: hypothetical protein KTR28_00485 [Micavibrio sp.]|nr:hypothetical protein [Micavibrio sp.]